MTSLIERLRDWKNMRDCQEAATALEQARALLATARAQTEHTLTRLNWADRRDAWLRLIDGEQEGWDGHG